VGGTWHPGMAYAGLSLHTPSFRCQFHDYPQPSGQDPLQRLPAADVFETCRAFARDRGLVPHIAFRHRVRTISWDTARRVHRLAVHDEAGGVDHTAEFDVVVSTQFNSPRVPAWPGQDQFEGQILHASAVKDAVLERLAADGARVVVVGGSKSATDMALQLAGRRLPFTWLLRRMYWFLSYDKGYWNFRRNRPASRVHRWLYFLGLGLARGTVSTRLVFEVWRRSGLLRCPGRPPADSTAFHHGWLDERQMDVLETQTRQVYDEIARLDGRAVHTRGGQIIPCDVLICATGSDPIASPIALDVDGALIDYGAVEHVYRFSVIPALPRLVFTGYWMFGFGPLNGYHRAAWLLDFIERNRSTGELDAIARNEGQAPFQFRRGSFLFDGGANLLVTVKAMNNLMSKGIYSYADLKRYYRDIAVSYRYAPIDGAHRFIEARRQKDR